jgi:peptide/nickel transport system permease protein
MARLIAYRLSAMVVLLWLVSVVVFSLVHLMPGSPAAAILGRSANPEAVAELEQQLGLDRPLHVQYLSWLGDAVTGDLGESLFSGANVGSLIAGRVSPTLSLTAGAVLVAVVLGIGAGILGALRAGSATDRSVSVASALGLSMPEFWVGIILLNVFAVTLGLFPVLSWTPPSRDVAVWLQGLVLPCVALGVAGSAVIARQTRGAMLDALEAPYVQTLRAIGTPERVIIYQYALKNAFVPVLTVISFITVVMMGGTFVIEKVFTIPGIGSLMLDAITRKDIPVVQGVTLIVALWVTFIYLVVDVCYGLLNPRVRPS